MWLFNICQSVGMWSGTHTSLIGEQTALYALRNSSFDCHTPATTNNGIRIKCIVENKRNSLWHSFKVCQKNSSTTDKIENSHNRNQLLSNSGNTLGATDKYEASQ